MALITLAFQLSVGELGRDIYAQSASPIGWVVYLWLLNPAVTYGIVLSGQLGDMWELTEILKFLGASQGAIDHWVLLSILVQILFVILLTALAVRYLDPQNERFRAGRLLKKHKSH